MLEMSDDHARDKMPLLMRILPRPAQKWVMKNVHPPLILAICIVLFLIVVPASLQSSLPSYTFGINDIYRLDPRYRTILRERQSNQYNFLTLPYRRQLLQSFTPYVRNESNRCIDRSKYRIEHARILGLDPYSDNLSTPRFLIIGGSSPIGRSVASRLNTSGIASISVGCQNFIDFASPDAVSLLDLLNITKAVVTCSIEYPMYSRTDGSDYLIGLHKYYARRLFSYFASRSIPYVLAVDRPLDDEICNLSIGGQVVVFPTLLSQYNSVASASRECAAKGMARVEIFDGEVLSDITSEEAADHILKMFESPLSTPQRAIPRSSVSIESAIHDMSGASCKVSVAKSPHRIKQKTEYQNFTIGSGSIDKFTRSALLSEKVVSPELSIVFCGRHDNFSSGFEQRTQNCLDSIGKGLGRAPGADIEVVFVDYATDENETKLHQILSIPTPLKGKVRFIIVPKKSHEKLQKRLGSDLAFFEYIAKNVGIRRASGRFVLASNPDNIFSSMFFEMIAKRELNPSILYRARRWNTYNDTELNHSISELTQNLGEPWLLGKMRVSERCYNGKYKFVISDSTDVLESEAFPCGAGDFLMMSKDLWLAVGGFNEYPANPNVDAVFLGKMMKLIPGYARSYIRPMILHQWHPRLNVHRAAIMNHTDVMHEYACYGESKALGKYNDSPRWGLASEAFEEVRV